MTTAVNSKHQFDALVICKRRLLA